MNKVITRIKGGLGNQLFCYASARRLALANDSELVIDNVSGFLRDSMYRRRYALAHFRLPCRYATPFERLEPGERVRRAVMKWASRRKPFDQRRYIEQEGAEFDPRLLQRRTNGTVYLDGVWANERYFKDIEPRIRDELSIVAPADHDNRRIAEEIRSANSVALHVRWFEAPGKSGNAQASVDYYRRAVAFVISKVESPRFFVFSDDPHAAMQALALPPGSATIVAHNQGDEMAYADLWLMTLCRHAITANSTFSWWGAWLGAGPGKLTVCPRLDFSAGKVSGWETLGPMPAAWTQL